MNTSFTPRDAAGLRERLAGPVVLPGQEEYDAARQVWNASHDHRPALIAQPLSVADVQAAVLFAADRGLPVSVRGGGDNHAGYAVADGALMLDLSAMTSVRVDPPGAWQPCPAARPGESWTRPPRRRIWP
jgi:FAD/FMN-containing dehydrogenase